MTDDVLRTAIFVVRTALLAAQDALEYAKTARLSLVHLRDFPRVSRQSVSPAATGLG